MSDKKFTWANSMPNPTYEELDRILMSTEWEQNVPLSNVIALSRDISDHTPLLVDTVVHHQVATIPYSKVTWVGYYVMDLATW
jgi:hypothetical protein